MSAGIVDEGGRLVGLSRVRIRTWEPKPGHVEQSGDEIWRACCAATVSALTQSSVSPAEVAGIGICGSASMVAIDRGGEPVPLSTTGDCERNVIAAADRRSHRQAQDVSFTLHQVLRSCGGVATAEMQVPRLLWLKENLPVVWRQTAQFFDLPDYLTYRATGSSTRSLCTTVCKWNYVANHRLDAAGWEASYFRQIGLGDLVHENFQRIGNSIRAPGHAVGNGLTTQAAKELGLVGGTPVSAAIDAVHARGIGLIGAHVEGEAPSKTEYCRRMIVASESHPAHLMVSVRPRHIDGLVGPHYSVMVPGTWCTEDHQLDPMPPSDPEFGVRDPQSHEVAEVPGYAERQPEDGKKGDGCGSLFPSISSKNSATPPAGRRIPSGEQTRRVASETDANVQTVQRAVERWNRRGFGIATLLVDGNLSSPVCLRELAEASGCKVVAPDEPESSLVGAALAGALASGRFGSLDEVLAATKVSAREVAPSNKPWVGHQRIRTRGIARKSTRLAGTWRRASTCA